MLTVCISGFADAGMLRGCLESVRAFGWPTIYLDGAYARFLDRPGDPWATDARELKAAIDGFDVEILPALPDRPWGSEAEKRTALLAAAWRRAGSGPALTLDTDERLEALGGSEHASGWLSRNLTEAHQWATVNLWPSDMPHARDGWPMPRILRAAPDLTFRPPQDYIAYRGETRIAYLPGERMPAECAGRYLDVPRDILRIRHDRHLRTVERRHQQGRYCERRKQDGAP